MTSTTPIKQLTHGQIVRGKWFSPYTPMIDPKLLKSDVLQRIVKDAQWEAGNQNLLALSAKASFLTESTQKFEAAANKYQRVAIIAIDELHSRGESIQ